MMMVMIRTIFEEVWITSVIMLMGEKPSGRINDEVEGEETEEQGREEPEPTQKNAVEQINEKAEQRDEEITAETEKDAAMETDRPIEREIEELILKMLRKQLLLNDLNKLENPKEIEIDESVKENIVEMNKEATESVGRDAARIERNISGKTLLILDSCFRRRDLDTLFEPEQHLIHFLRLNAVYLESFTTVKSLTQQLKTKNQCAKCM